MLQLIILQHVVQNFQPVKKYFKISILRIKNLSQFTYKKNNNKISEDTSDSDVNQPGSTLDENNECITQINIVDTFSSTFFSLLDYCSVFHEQFFHELTSTDF